MAKLTIVGPSDSNSAAELTKPIENVASIEGTSFELALDEQRESLFEATSIIDCVAHAIEREFGQDCPAGRPEFPRALRTAGRMLDRIASGLEACTLEERSKAIAREEA